MRAYSHQSHLYTATMHPRQSNSPNNPSTPAKPLTPTISTALRSSKLPLTPKLAGQFQPATTRKPPSTGTPSDTSTRGALASPYISPNVTPRSGSRMARASGTSSPVQKHPPTSPTGLGGGHAGSHHSSSTMDEQLCGRSTRPRTLDVSNIHSQPSSSATSSVSSPMFFHADDTRSSTSSLAPEPKPQARPATFLHADGSVVESTPPRPARRSSGASGIEEKRHIFSLSQHPSSSHPKLQPLSPRHRLPQPEHNHDIPPIPPLPPLPIKTDPVLPGPDKRMAHGKSISIDSSNISLPPYDLPSSPQSRSSVDHQFHQSMSPVGGEPLTRIPSSHSGVSEMPRSSSPVRDMSNKTPIQKMNDLASNARRERKVLDLEISNSSLLAINRALERELRKQNAEIRRFRRLNRAGRLSQGLRLSELSAVNEDADAPENATSHSDHPDSEDPDHSDSESHSSFLASSPGGHGCDNNDRLMEDLAKHQELLTTSQKINQSIQRCVLWTETLILEGKKALDHTVGISDVTVGGRVLNSDELDPDTYAAQSLLSPPPGIEQLLPPSSVDQLVVPLSVDNDGEGANEEPDNVNDGLDETF